MNCLRIDSQHPGCTKLQWAANCIAFNQLQRYYREHVEVFHAILDKNKTELPARIMSRVSPAIFERLADAPLTVDRALHDAPGDHGRKVHPRAHQRPVSENVNSQLRRLTDTVSRHQA